MSTVSSPFLSSSAIAATSYLSPARSINTSPSAGTDAGIQTASESECNTDDDSSLDTVSINGDYAEQLQESGSGSDVGNESHATISSRRSVRKIKRPPVIFFGTPSKAEHERRDKYNARVRTRRLLRKDSIELTRRKSGGWEGRNSIARAEADDPAKSNGATGSEEEDEEASRQASPSHDDAAVPENARLALELSSLSIGLPAMDVDDAQEFHPEEDPDATEEADWFGMKNRSQLLEQSSLPSTPIRRRPSKAVSDAGSSPGIGRAFSVSASNRPSPFFRNGDLRRSFASPGLSSNHSNATSPRFNDENVDLSRGSFYAPSPSITGAAKILQESPRKGNANPSAPLSMSPLKLDLRQKMAAWAETKVKTPQSPEKREWEQLSNSMSAAHVLRSPSFSQNARSVAALEMAKNIPLPDSPEKQVKINSLQSGTSDIDQHLSKGRLPSPAKQSGHDRQPPSSQTRLPRPVTAVTGKVLPTSISRQTIGASYSAKVSVPVKRTLASQMQTITRLAPDKLHQNTLHQSLPNSTNSSSTATSSPHDMFERRAKFAGAASSSPLKLSAAKAAATIVRDARLIASRRPEAEKSNPHRSSVTRDDQTLLQTEVQDARENQDIAAIVPAKRVVSIPSAGVGGARRIAIGSTQPAKVLSAPMGNGQGQSARLRAQGTASQTEGGKSKVVPNRKMRRINDYVQRPSIAEKAAVVETKVLSVAKQAATRDVFRAAPAIPLQRSLHTQPAVPREESQEVVGTPAGLPTEAENKCERQVTTAQRAHSSTMSRLLPLSGAEMSKITSLHTQCNETSVSQIRLVIIRKHGEVRPASPSSKFRKSSSIAVSVSKSERLAREAQDRESRAAQRSARFSGDSDSVDDGKGKTAAVDADESGNLLMPGAFHQPPPSKHRLGAGDEEPFYSPLRRVSLKKNVRWHRALFDRSNAVESVDLVSSRNARQPTRSILRESCRTLALDRFGNVAKAGKPMNSSSDAKQQQVVRVTRIVYDDDVVDSMDS